MPLIPPPSMLKTLKDSCPKIGKLVKARKTIIFLRHMFPPNIVMVRGSLCFVHLIYGADKRNRTADLLITNQSLYQLSYAGPKAKMAFESLFVNWNNARHKDGSLRAGNF